MPKHKPKLKIVDSKDDSATKIQAWWRGCALRKDLKKMDDKYTFEILNKCLDKYITNLVFNDEINSVISIKKIRNENFPSNISENIVKLAIANKYNVMPCWDTEKGDLVINKKDISKQIEVKGFTSTGPSSFGPTENWDWLYFVNGIDIRNKKFKVYEIKLSNTSETWRSIKITKTETYGEQCDRRVRPHCGFEKIFKPQLGEHCKLIFDGHISELDNSL
tara:strand:- start:1199 stop:1858 length:660 start_codon:yes stop_codon:yes gene_type:complete